MAIPVLGQLFKRGRGRPKGSGKSAKVEAKDWLERIQRAKKVREKWYEEQRIAQAYEFYEGFQRPPEYATQEWITLNLIYAMLESILPSLYSTDPYFYVTLKKSYQPHPMLIALYEQMGRVRQSMLNYLKGELSLKSTSRLAIKDAFFEYGVIKVHSSADLLENPRAGETIKDGEDELTGEDGQPILQPDYIPANQAYHITRIHPADFLVDEDAGPLDEDVSWKAQRIRRPLEDVQADKRYSASARKAVQATELSEDLRAREERKKGSAFFGSSKAKPADVVTLWEVYDLPAGQWLTLAEGCEEFLRAPSELPEGIEESPFVDLRWTLRADSWYPLPPVSQWLDPQREYSESRSRLLRHRKNVSARKYAVLDTAFQDPDQELSKLEYGDDGAIVRYQNPVGFVPVTPISDAPLDQQIHTELAYLRHDFDDLAVGANQRGSTQGVDSATEAGILEARSRMREGDKLGQISDFLSEIARKLDQTVQANLTQDQAIKVTGPQGEFWELVRTQDYDQIEGEYEYSIDVGSTVSQTPEIERAQWTAFLGLLANAPQLMLSKTLLKEQARMHHIENELLIEELYQIGQKIMTGQLPMPGQQGSLPGAPDGMTGPASMVGGAATGINNVRGGTQ